MSSFGMRRLIGVPSVCPSKRPVRICTVAGFLPCDTSALCPGARGSGSGWMAASDRGSRGGQPSTTAPVAPPCDSPHVVTRKRRPQVLPMRRGYVSRCPNSKPSGMARDDRRGGPRYTRAEPRMADLWTRISASRDYVAVFTVLGAALSLLLTQLGAATWQTISRILPAAAVVFAFLAWLRPRVFPTWRLLELCLYAGQRFPVTRSIDDALYCFWWAAWRRRGCRLRTFDVARLRVEAELLTGGKDRGGAASAERRWREHLEAMLNERRLMQYTSPADPRFRTEIPDCLPLTSSVVFPGVDHYFKTLASVGRVDGHFLSEVHVASAYVAPLYLLTGQLGHFDDNWRAIVHAYADVTSIHDPISDESLRHLRAFQFACWIVWGPSIPICTCSSWNHEGKDAIGFQLGYGDENTSVRWAMRIEQPQHSAEFTGMARHLDGRAQVALVPLDHYAGYDRARPFVIREITAGDADLPAVRAIYEAHFPDRASAMGGAALGSGPAGASRRRNEPAYHLLALRPTPPAPAAPPAS